LITITFVFYIHNHKKKNGDNVMKKSSSLRVRLMSWIID